MMMITLKLGVDRKVVKRTIKTEVKVRGKGQRVEMHHKAKKKATKKVM